MWWQLKKLVGTEPVRLSFLPWSRHKSYFKLLVGGTECGDFVLRETSYFRSSSLAGVNENFENVKTFVS